MQSKQQAIRAYCPNIYTVNVPQWIYLPWEKLISNGNYLFSSQFALTYRKSLDMPLLHIAQCPSTLVGCVALGMRNKWTIFGLTENVVRCMWFVCVCSFCIFDTRIPRGPRNSFVVSHFFTSNLHRFSIWTYNSICRFSKIWRFQFVVVHLTINYFAFWTNDS